MKKWSFWFIIAFVMCVSFPCLAQDEYIVEKGDILSVRVWEEEALSAEVLVRPDGRISLPGVGTLMAAGYTTGQLESIIARKLSDLVHAPMVSVMLRSSFNNSVVVHGPGVSPSVLPLEGKTTLLEVLSKAGIDAKSDLYNAYIERGDQRITSNFHALFYQGNREYDIEIRGGDIIYIPLHEGRFVFVEGAVASPSSIPFYEGMTVLEAIHLAGGFTKFASKNKTVVMRKTLAGKQDILVKLEDLTEKGDFSQNILLRGGDIVVVKKGWF